MRNQTIKNILFPELEPEPKFKGPVRPEVDVEHFRRTGIEKPRKEPDEKEFIKNIKKDIDFQRQAETIRRLPRAELRQAPPKEEFRDTLLKRTGRAILPRSLELRLGLTEPTQEEKISEKRRNRDVQTQLKRFGLQEQPGLLGIGPVISPSTILKETARFATRTGVTFLDMLSEGLDFSTDLATRNIDLFTPMGLKTRLTPQGQELRNQWLDFYNSVRDEIPTQRFKEAVDKLEQIEFIQPKQEWVEASTKEKMTTRLGETILNIGPSIVASIGNFAINPLFGIGVTATSVAGGVKDDAVAHGLEEGKAEMLGLTTGVLVSALERIVPARIFGGNLSIKNRFLGSFSKRLADTIMLEAGTEITQEGIQMLAEETFRDIEMGELTERVVLAGFGGILGGAGMQSIATFANKVQREQLLKDLAPIGLTIEDVSKNIEDEIDPRVKPEIAPETAIPAELEPLAREARKFKTAEEFVIEKLPEKFGLRVEEGTKLTGHGMFVERENKIIIPKVLRKGYNKEEIIAHEIGHFMHTKVSQEDLDNFNSLVKSFRKEIDELFKKPLGGMEEKWGRQAYFEYFAELYGRYIRGEKLPAGNQFKFYFDEVAPPKITKPQLIDIWKEAQKAVKEVTPEVRVPEMEAIIPQELPTPEEVKKKLKITPRREREINRLGITPEEFIPALEAQKRGVMTFPDIAERAKKLNIGLDALIEKIRVHKVIDVVETERLRQMRNKLKTDTNQLRDNWIADPSHENKKKFDETRKKLNQASMMIEATRSEGARLLGATRMQDDAEIAARNLNTIRAALKPDKQILFDNAIDNLDLQDPIAVTKIIHQYQKIPFIYKVLEYWRAALLSALITQVRNATGNTLFLAFDVPVRAFAGGLDVVRAKVRGKERTVYAGEALKLIYGGVRAVPQATREAMKQLRDEYYIYGSREQMQRMNIEAGLRAPAIKGVKGAIIRIPYRFLGMMDLFSRTIKTGMETDALAYREAKKKGLKGAELVEEIEKIKRNPPPEMIEQIHKRADRALFLEEMTGILKTIEEGREKHPYSQFIMPFYRTPVNLLREAYRLTPLRLATAKKDPWLLDQSTRMEEISRTIIGSLIMGSLIWGILEDEIEFTGPAPRDKNERMLFHRQGKIPFGVRIGNHWYSYQQIHPFSTLAFGAFQISEMIKLYRETGTLTEEQLLEQADRLITDTSSYIQDLTFFQGLANFMELVTGGAHNQGILAAGGNVLARFFGGFIPNIFYSFQRAADPTIYYRKGLKDEIRARIPGMQEALYPRRDIYGQELKRPGTFIMRFLSPIQVSKERRNIVDEEMKALEIAIGHPTKTAFGEPLTDYEWNAFLQDSGARLYEELHSLVTSERYKRMAKYEKQEAFEDIAREVRADSREALFENKRDIAEYRKELKREGLTDFEIENRIDKRFGADLKPKEIYRPDVRPRDIEQEMRNILFPELTP